jgi:hypothetical protein
MFFSTAGFACSLKRARRRGGGLLFSMRLVPAPFTQPVRRCDPAFSPPPPCASYSLQPLNVPDIASPERTEYTSNLIKIAEDADKQFPEREVEIFW